MRELEFRDIIEKYEKLIFTICLRFVNDFGEAQNLTQDTFLSAYAHIESCSEEGIKPWLSRIAANKCKDFLKSAYHQKVTAKDREEFAALKDPSAIPETLFIEKETISGIQKEIQSMREPYRQAAVMYFIEEKSIAEIAQTLGRPPQTVKTQIFRARNMLQKEIKGGV